MKKHRIWIGILIFAAILLLFAGGIGIYAQSNLNKINRVNKEEEVFVDPSSEDFEIDEELAARIQSDSESEIEVVDPKDIDWGDLNIPVVEDQDVINLLLIGQDRREGQGRQRSDTMIICSIDTRRDKIILSSVMRDLYVPIPVYSDNRINAAYQFGGMTLLDQVMEESLGIHIDGNIEVDFSGFINSLSAVGNLDIELNEAEAEYLNTHVSWVEQAGASGEGWSLKAGVNSMTPEQVLAYSRIRYVGNSDWERTDRQRRVLIAAFDKVKDQGITGITKMADNILPNLTTDLTDMQIIGYIYTILANGITEIESYRIPVEGTYSCQTLSYGMEVLVPDLAANSRALQEYIYGTEGE